VPNTLLSTCLCFLLPGKQKVLWLFSQRQVTNPTLPIKVAKGGKMTSYKGSEKRKHARMNGNFVINYQIQELPYSYDLSQTKNVSQGGVLLTTNKLFDKGEHLTINLKIPFVSQKIKLKGEVVGSREVARNLVYETRVKFVGLDKDFFSKLGDFIEENLK